MVTKNDFYKGQKVYVEELDPRHENHFEEVKSAGDKFIKLHPTSRELWFDANTLLRFQVGSAKLWPSKEVYDRYIESVHLRSDLYREMEVYIQNLPDDPAKLQRLVNRYKKKNGRKTLSKI